MKQRFFFGAFLIVCMTLIAACGGNGNSSTSNNGGTASASPTSTGNARAVNVTITDTKIESSKVSFSANLPYDFTITNKGIPLMISSYEDVSRDLPLEDKRTKAYSILSRQPN